MKSLLVSIVAAVLLVGCGPSESINEAAAFGNIKAVKQQLAADANVNAKDRMGWTPFCEAAIIGHKEIAELLFANGADVNVKDDRGMAPLDWASNKSFRRATAPLFNRNTKKPQTSFANTAARRVKNWKLKGNETPTNNNNSSRAGCGVWGVAVVNNRLC